VGGNNKDLGGKGKKKKAGRQRGASLKKKQKKKSLGETSHTGEKRDEKKGRTPAGRMAEGDGEKGCCLMGKEASIRGVQVIHA